MRFGIGQPVTRKEDPRFLTGRGRYVADIDLARQAHAVFVYSTHAHARIGAIDKIAAEQMPGVNAVLTGEDWAADGLGTLDPEVMAEDMGGPKGYRTQRPPLAIGRVRHVGERVAIVVAATEAQARDAADPCMSVRRKGKDGVRLADQIDIRDIAPPPGQKPNILLARNRLSDTEPHAALSEFARVAYSSARLRSMWRRRAETRLCRIALRASL